METKIIQNEPFFREIAIRVAEGGRVRIRAKGNSMLPLIRDGKDEIILEKPTGRSFRKGRLLLVKLIGERYVLHRVKIISDNFIMLRGDGNLSVFETCAREDVIAEATEVIRNGKEIRVGSARWNLYRYLWPRNIFLRRVCLALYRRMLFS
ncbi:S24/S26 family peptidase [Proteiniphilum sp. UBA5384]|uniref:S24/S26 family peptidase n=1 Tax=Proteiniphilum sp. UBA5384 TaxID=1947279 RepID=UPI0025D59EA1|nr:S24/S26 family peptidase [Proteiniphilum sp. UBA5384]